MDFSDVSPLGERYTIPGTSRKNNDGFDSGMDEAEAALNSDEDFSGEEFHGK